MAQPKVTITAKNGQEVDCYGGWQLDSNLCCVFDDEMLDGVWCGDENITTLKQAVNHLAEYAERNNTTLIEVSAV